MLGQPGNIDENRVAAPVVGYQALVLQLLADLQRIRVGMVNFVDGDENGNFRRLGVRKRFNRLRHDAVVGGNDQHNEVGDIGAAGAHGTERRVSRRVQERDLSQLFFALRMRHRNRVGADMLGDAAGLARRDIGLANDVEQRGLAVVNVAHDGHDRRAWFEFFRLVLDVEFDFFLERVDGAAAAFARFSTSKLKPYFAQSCCGDFFVNRLVDGGKNAQLDQIGDNDERLLLELLGEFADDDRRLDDNDFGGSPARQILGRARCGGFGRLARGRRVPGGRLGSVENAGANLFFAACRDVRAAVWPVPPVFRRRALTGVVGNWINPTLSPICGPTGLGGGDGNFGAVGFGISTDRRWRGRRHRFARTAGFGSAVAAR